MSSGLGVVVKSVIPKSALFALGLLPSGKNAMSVTPFIVALK